MFVFISDIFECRIECKNSNDFSIGLRKGLVIFLFENTCGMWRRQWHTIMISVMCKLPMVYMCKLKYSGKMIKSYRFSMTPVKTVESFYLFNTCSTYTICLQIRLSFAWLFFTVFILYYMHNVCIVLYFCLLSAVQFGPWIHTLGLCVFKILV